MAVHPRLGNGRRIGPHVAGIAVWQIEHEEVRLLLHTADLDQSLAEISLCVAGGVRQRHEHLPAALIPLPDVILDDRVASGEAMLFAKAVEHTLRRMALLARNRPVPFQPAIDDRYERFQLRSPHRGAATVTGRHRIRQHLANRVARYVEMLRCLALAHAFRTRQTNPQVKFHGVNPSSLLASFAKREKWTTFTPPAAALRRRYRGLILHRRSHSLRLRHPRGSTRTDVYPAGSPGHVGHLDLLAELRPYRKSQRGRPAYLAGFGPCQSRDDRFRG